MQDYFEYQVRDQASDWQLDKYTDNGENEINGAMTIQCPKGWDWEGDWDVDTNRACDEDGE